MYTQNTPIHVKLWHREFWHLAIANLLLTMSVYMLIPTLPVWLLKSYSALETGIVMGVFGAGLLLLGGFCSFLVQHYRRNQVCMWAIGAMILCLALLYYFTVFGSISYELMLIIRIAHGMFFRTLPDDSAQHADYRHKRVVPAHRGQPQRQLVRAFRPVVGSCMCIGAEIIWRTFDARFRHGSAWLDGLLCTGGRTDHAG